MTLVDLSHEIEHGTTTHLVTPARRFPDGHDLAGLPLERCADLPAVVVDAGWRALGPEAFVDLTREELAGAAVLLRTGWDRHWGTAAYGGPTHPYLTAAGARHLVEAGVALVGIDSVGIDDTSPAAGDDRPTSTALLAAGVPVVEHLTALELLPDDGFRFTAVPPRVRGLATSPVRAFAVVP